MKGYLLDTNVLLLATSRSSMLSVASRDALISGPVYASTLSYWEVVLKSMKGKLDVGDPRHWWRDTITDLAAIPLSVHPQHISEINNLPPFHTDPFDRALIAQALVEDLTFLTTDGLIQRYATETFRVIT